MGKKKLPPGIVERGNRWAIDTFYKGHRLRDSFATPEMAEANLRKIKTLIDEGRYLEKKHESPVSLGEFAETYLEQCEKIGQKAIQSKRCHIEKILEYFGKDRLVCKLTKADVEGFQAEMLSAPVHRKTTAPKPATVNRRLATLKHLLTKASESGIIQENPARGIKLLKENNRRLRYLSGEECAKLLDACPSPTLRNVVELALNTGMRKGEILNLKWENVHLREGFIELPDQKNGERGTVPLNQTAVDLLRSIPRRLDSDYVFTGKVPGEHFWDLKRIES